MFEVTVKKSLFASHGLRNYSGGVEAPHDHNWIIEAMFESNLLDSAGCAIDFREIDRAFQEILLVYQGKNLNELEPFRTTSPSAENIARNIFEQLSSLLKKNKANLVSITAWEDEEHGATYLMTNDKAQMSK